MNKYSGNKRAFIYSIFEKPDREQVFAVLERLEKENYALCWEDKKAIQKASLVLAFISKSLLLNEEKTKEISEAFAKNRNILPIFLDDVTLPPGLSMLFGSTQGIFKNNLSEEEFYKKLLASPLLEKMEISSEQKADSKKKAIGLTVSLVAVAVAAIFVFVSGVFDTIAPDSLLQKMGISGRVNDVKEIYLYGDELLDDFHTCCIQGFNSAEGNYVLIDHQRYGLGEISDISDFAVLKNLEELALVGNRITSIEPLYGLEKLRLLDLTGNSGVSIEGISALKNLEVLNISATDITDFSELMEMESLKTVYVSGDYYDQVSNIEGRQFEIISVDTIVRNFEDLKKATNDDSVISITILGRVIIPEGETITLKKDVPMSGHGGDDSPRNEVYFENNGTLIVEGMFGMGLSTRALNGTTIIRDGGVYTGGMCDSALNGTMIIEKGGVMYIERAHQFAMDSGTFENNGKIVFTAAGGVYHRDGDFVNNGDIYFNNIMYSGLSINREKFVDNGNYYYYNNGDMENIEYNPPYEKVTVDYLIENSFKRG